MKSKWISRKLFVAIAGVVAIAIAIAKGDPEIEGQLTEQMSTFIDAAWKIIAIYLGSQGAVDLVDKIKNGG